MRCPVFDRRQPSSFRPALTQVIASPQRRRRTRRRCLPATINQVNVARPAAAANGRRNGAAPPRRSELGGETRSRDHRPSPATTARRGSYQARRVRFVHASHRSGFRVPSPKSSRRGPGSPHCRAGGPKPWLPLRPGRMRSVGRDALSSKHLIVRVMGSPTLDERGSYRSRRTGAWPRATPGAK